MFAKRSDKLELMDTGDYTPEEYEGCLLELRRVNRWLGDESALKNSLLRDVENSALKEFSVLDVGAGSGEFLRIIAKFAQSKNLRAQLCGLELNARSAQSITEESKDYQNIRAIRGDAFRLPFADGAFDYVVCSLFTHHFANENVVAVLSEMNRLARRKIFVIDLHRHPVAYYFYTTVGKLFLYNRLIRHDGALSILRSFTPTEFETLGRAANLKNLTVKKHFPYRLILSAEK